MAPIVWFAMSLALWHFVIYLPRHVERFWGGIMGPLLAGCIGAMLTGAVWQIATGSSIGQTDLMTAIAAVPGWAVGTGLTYLPGLRAERQGAEAELLEDHGDVSAQ
jgi:predicted lipid-binding transport protein (Tim44 family)